MLRPSSPGDNAARLVNIPGRTWPLEIAVSRHPVSDNCPNCGGTASTKVKPKTPHFTGQWDRLCSACGTRYTPPIPVWAALVLIALGTALVLVSLYVAFVALAGATDTQDVRTKVVRYVGTFAMVALGLALAGVGVRRLIPRRGRGVIRDERKQSPDDAPAHPE